MRKSRFTESQIIRILREAEGGRKAADVCREYGVSQAAYYKWKSKYGGGMEASNIHRLKDLEEENRKLNRYKPRPRATTRHSLKRFSRWPSGIRVTVSGSCFRSCADMVTDGITNGSTACTAC